MTFQGSNPYQHLALPQKYAVYGSIIRLTEGQTPELDGAPDSRGGLSKDAVHTRVGLCESLQSYEGV